MTSHHLVTILILLQVNFASVLPAPPLLPYSRGNSHSRLDMGLRPAQSERQRCLVCDWVREAHDPIRALRCSVGWMALLREMPSLFSLLLSLSSGEGGSGTAASLLPSHVTCEGNREERKAESWWDIGFLWHCSGPRTQLYIWNFSYISQ